MLLLKNLSQREKLVNGSSGVVVRFVLATDVLDGRIGVPVAGHADSAWDATHLKPCFQRLGDNNKCVRRVCLRCAFSVAHEAVPALRYVPVVLFRNVGERIVVPSGFTSELANVGTCSRFQIPLKVAFAITVHKACLCVCAWRRVVGSIQLTCPWQCCTVLTVPRHDTRLRCGSWPRLCFVVAATLLASPGVRVCACAVVVVAARSTWRECSARVRRTLP